MAASSPLPLGFGDNSPVPFLPGQEFQDDFFQEDFFQGDFFQDEHNLDAGLTTPEMLVIMPQAYISATEPFFVKIDKGGSHATFTCVHTDCNKTIKNRSGFIRHMETQHIKEAYVCERSVHGNHNKGVTQKHRLRVSKLIRKHYGRLNKKNLKALYKRAKQMQKKEWMNVCLF